MSIRKMIHLGDEKEVKYLPKKIGTCLIEAVYNTRTYNINHEDDNGIQKWRHLTVKIAKFY